MNKIYPIILSLYFTQNAYGSDKISENKPVCNNQQQCVLSSMINKISPCRNILRILTKDNPYLQNIPK